VSHPLLCVTVTAPSTAELRRQRDEVADADLIELRLDSVSDPTAAGALAGRRGAVVVTCRPAWEGGGFAGAEEDRRRILAEALALGAEYVDIEWRANFNDLLSQTGGRRVVLSCHDFDGMPTDLSARAQVMRSTGAEVVKIAAATRRLSDCVPLLDLGAKACREGGLVVIGMGEMGLATRVLAGRFGSKWMYAGSEGQLGQLSAQTLVEEYRFRSLSDATEVYGLVGKPISHSVSPAMHNAAFVAARRDAVYLPFPAAGAEDFVTFARALGVKGASITTPYKVEMLDHVDEVDPAARRIGAINTVHVKDGRWLGGNTDATAFLQPLHNRVPLVGTRAAILGAGGAARAVAIALGPRGAHVRVHARNQQQAEGVARQASAEVGAWPPESGSWDLLINCTSVGMYPRVDETPVPASQLTGRYVYDLVYNPTTTRLLREARLAGCRTIGGLDMLVAQAHEQYQWWTGAEPRSGVMREAALKRLAEFARDAHYVA
jgi:3-dehydroquinate dehydratase / shikimate dehydrogenase